MYAGRIVELGPAEELFESSGAPLHPSAVGAIPRLAGGRSLVGIPGHAPSPGKRPSGCAFAPRCTLRIDECDAEVPTAAHGRARAQRRAASEPLEVRRRRSRRKVGDPVALVPADDDSAVLTLENVVALLRQDRGAALDQPDARARTSSSPSSVSRGRARRRPREPSPVCTTTGPATIRLGDTELETVGPGAQHRRRAARSSTSSRTPTAR